MSDVLWFCRSSEKEKGEASSTKKPATMGGTVQITNATRLKPAARAAETPTSCSPTTQKNCHEPRLLGVLGRKVPIMMMAKTAAASSRARCMW